MVKSKLEYTVEGVINDLNNKKVTIKKLADLYGVSDRTVQNKIKALGFVWNQKESKYESTGEKYDENNNKTLFLKYFQPKTRIKKTDENNKEKKILSDSIDSMERVSSSDDSYDELILDYFGKGNKPKKIQKGYFLSPDVIAVLDKIERNDKSRVVDLILRKYFEEHGLL